MRGRGLRRWGSWQLWPTGVKPGGGMVAVWSGTYRVRRKPHLDGAPARRARHLGVRVSGLCLLWVMGGAPWSNIL